MSKREGDTGPLKAYLKEIRDINPLTRDKEVELAREGGEPALRELVQHNLKYVVMVANKYKGMGLSLTDLINEGNIGMLQAARRFDPERGIKFISYAVWWIRQAIIQALADQARVVRLPVKQAGLLVRITRKINSLTQQLSREPTMDELADDLQIKRSTLDVVMRVYRSYMSLDSPISGDEEGACFIDMIESDPTHSVEEDFIRLCFRHDMEKMLKILPRREENVIRMRFGFDDPPRTLESIGKQMGLTRERIRQIEKAAKKKLRSSAGIKILEDYLN